MFGLPLTAPHPSLQVFSASRILLHETKRDEDGTGAVAADKQRKCASLCRSGSARRAHTAPAVVELFNITLSQWLTAAQKHVCQGRAKVPLDIAEMRKGRQTAAQSFLRSA
jgi:hypothetical protein